MQFTGRIVGREEVTVFSTMGALRLLQVFQEVQNFTYNKPSVFLAR